MIDSVPVQDIQKFQNGLFEFFEANHRDLLDVIVKTGDLPDEDKLTSAITEFADGFSK